MLIITSSPEKISPAFNPVIIEAMSDEQARADFKYIVEIKDGVGNVLATKKQIGGAGLYDVARIDVSSVLAKLQDFSAWRHDVTGAEYIYHVPGFRPAYSVVISEAYDGTTHDTETITGVYTIPAALPSIRLPYWNYHDVKERGQWLTNFEKMKVRAEDKLTASYLMQEGGAASFEYNFFSASGSVLAAFTKTNPFPALAEDVLHIHCGLAQVAAFCGLSAELAANVSRYTINPINGAVMTFLVVKEDCRFKGVRVHFLNEWGAVDSFLFNLAHRRGVSIEKKKAKLAFDGSQLRPSMYGVGPSPYLVKFTDNLKLTSDFISDNDSNALIGMFTAPIVSVETEQNIFFPAPEGQKIVLPCEIDLTNYDIKQSNIEKLFNLELEVKISVDNKRQSL